MRVEHIRQSKCRKDFLDRVKRNEDIKRQAKAFNDLGVIPKDVSGDIEKYWDTAILAAAMK